MCVDGDCTSHIFLQLHTSQGRKTWLKTDLRVDACAVKPSPGTSIRNTQKLVPGRLRTSFFLAALMVKEV